MTDASAVRPDADAAADAAAAKRRHSSPWRDVWAQFSSHRGALAGAAGAKGGADTVDHENPARRCGRG